MNTGFYLWIGYSVFWLLPSAYLFYLFRKLRVVEKELQRLDKK